MNLGNISCFWRITRGASRTINGNRFDGIRRDNGRFPLLMR